MLGPSGSGKTTCLRLIAGFEQPTAGHIEIFGERADGVPPYRRNVNTVFQDYALFPHLNVLDNVAYGLMVKGVGKAERLQGGRGGAGAGPAARLWRAPARPAFRRPAPARRARPRAGQPAQGAAARRAARRARPEAAREHAGRAEDACRNRSASPSSSSPTTRARRCRWPTASPSSTTASIMQIGTPQEIYQQPELALRRRFRRLVQRAAARFRRSAIPASGAGGACGRRAIA